MPLVGVEGAKNSPLLLLCYDTIVFTITVFLLVLQLIVMLMLMLVYYYITLRGFLVLLYSQLI